MPNTPMQRVSRSSGYSVSGRDFGMNALPISKIRPSKMPLFWLRPIAWIICGARVVLIRDRSSLIGFMMRIALRSGASAAKPIWSKSDGEKKE